MLAELSSHAEALGKYLFQSSSWQLKSLFPHGYKTVITALLLAVALGLLTALRGCSLSLSLWPPPSSKSTMNNLFYFESLSNFYSLWFSLLPQHGGSSLLSKGSSDSDRSTQTISLSLVNSLTYLITGLVSHHIHSLYSREAGCSYTGHIRWGHFSVCLPHGLRESVVKREVAGNPYEGAQILQLLVFTPLCNLFPSVSWP